MKKLRIFFLFLATQVFSYSQDNCKHLTYTFKIEDIANVPSVTNQENNTILLTHRENYITAIFSKYKIYSFGKAFPNASSETLKSYYLIEYDNKDLINELKNNVPEEIFYLEIEYKFKNIDTELVSLFETPVVFEMKEFLLTSDADPCTFDCNLMGVPNDFSIAIRIFYDENDDELIVESTKDTSCGNSFRFSFRMSDNQNSEPSLTLWKSNSSLCNENNTLNCEIEKAFTETIFGDFTITLASIENTLTLRAPNPVFGENIFRFEQQNLSVKNQQKENSNITVQNPIKDFVKLKDNSFNSTIREISIYNNFGEKVLSTQRVTDPISISFLSTGYYFLKVETSQRKILYKKIIKI